MNKLFYTITFFGFLFLATARPMNDSGEQLEAFESPYNGIRSHAYNLNPEGLLNAINKLKNDYPNLPDDWLAGFKDAVNDNALHYVAEACAQLEANSSSKTAKNALQCAEILYSHCPELLTSKNIFKETPLHRLFEDEDKKLTKTSRKIAKFLIEKSPIELLSKEDSSGETPLSYIFLNEKCHKLLPALQKKGITDFDTPPSRFNMTPLYLAAGHKCNYKSIEALLKAGANPNITTEECHDTPVDCAQHEECKKLLGQYSSAYTWTPQLLRTLRPFASQGSINSFKRMKK